MKTFSTLIESFARNIREGHEPTLPHADEVMRMLLPDVSNIRILQDWDAGTTRYGVGSEAVAQLDNNIELVCHVFAGDEMRSTGQWQILARTETSLGQHVVARGTIDQIVDAAKADKARRRLEVIASEVAAFIDAEKQYRITPYEATKLKNRLLNGLEQIGESAKGSKMSANRHEWSTLIEAFSRNVVRENYSSMSAADILNAVIPDNLRTGPISSSDDGYVAQVGVGFVARNDYVVIATCEIGDDGLYELRFDDEVIAVGDAANPDLAEASRQVKKFEREVTMGSGHDTMASMGATPMAESRSRSPKHEWTTLIEAFGRSIVVESEGVCPECGKDPCKCPSELGVAATQVLQQMVPNVAEVRGTDYEATGKVTLGGKIVDAMCAIHDNGKCVIKVGGHQVVSCHCDDLNEKCRKDVVDYIASKALKTESRRRIGEYGGMLDGPMEQEMGYPAEEAYYPLPDLPRNVKATFVEVQQMPHGTADSAQILKQAGGHTGLYNYDNQTYVIVANKKDSTGAPTVYSWSALSTDSTQLASQLDDIQAVENALRSAGFKKASNLYIPQYDKYALYNV